MLLFDNHAVASAWNNKSTPVFFLELILDFSCAALNTWSNSSLFNVKPFSSHMISVKSFGKPKDSHNKNASTPEMTFLFSPLAPSAIFLNFSIPFKSVFPNDSSSSAMISMTLFSSFLISGNVSPSIFTTVGTNLWKKPCLAFNFSRPNRTALLKTLLKT